MSSLPVFLSCKAKQQHYILPSYISPGIQLQETSEIYWSHPWAVQYCFTAKQEKILQLRSQIHVSNDLQKDPGDIEKRGIVKFSLQVYLILWHELNNAHSLKDSWAHFQMLWMNFFKFPPACSSLLSQPSNSSGTSRKKEPRGLLSSVSLIHVDWCPLPLGLYPEETPWSFLSISWGTLDYCLVLQIVWYALGFLLSVNEGELGSLLPVYEVFQQ